MRFAELPVTKWHDLPVEDKRKHRIVDGAGLSILRAGREVDYGWWFFGAKRRENYDSWWRGELSFEPELDELFAITHSKQGINPTPEIREILTPDLEAAARQLNSRVQAAFAAVKQPERTDAPQPDPDPAPERNGDARHKPSSAAPVPTSNGRHTAPPVAHSDAPEPKKETHPYSVAVIRLRGGRFFESRHPKRGAARLPSKKTVSAHRSYKSATRNL